jgi:hypothetical protein
MFRTLVQLQFFEPGPADDQTQRDIETQIIEIYYIRRLLMKMNQVSEQSLAVNSNTKIEETGIFWLFLMVVIDMLNLIYT